MPCSCDHLEPNEREAALQEAAALLVYVYGKLKKKPPQWLVSAAADPYGTDDRPYRELCDTLKSLTPKQTEAIVYDARNRKSRDLADWWDAHQQADLKRVERAKRGAEERKIRAKALKKLTKQEREVLGL